MSHINSTSRDKLNGKTPYEAELLILDEDEINKLGVEKIKADEVNLSPKLLKEAEQSRKIIQTYKENYLQYNKYKRYYSED